MDTNGATTSSAAGGASTSTSDSSSAAIKNSKKPKYSRFTQQKLPACKPILTPALVITTFAIIGIIFIPIGLVSLSASEHVVEIVDRYDEGCVPPNYSNDKLAYIQSSLTNKSCTRTLSVPKLMKSPIFIYYQLDNFYQNHRRYVKSRSDKQLRSKAYERDTKSCDPESVSVDGPIVPCGLIAWSLFNDTYGFSVKKWRVDWRCKTEFEHTFK